MSKKLILVGSFFLLLEICYSDGKTPPKQVKSKKTKRKPYRPDFWKSYWKERIRIMEKQLTELRDKQASGEGSKEMIRQIDELEYQIKQGKKKVQKARKKIKEVRKKRKAQNNATKIKPRKNTRYR